MAANYREPYLGERKIRCDYEDRGCRELVQAQNLNRHVAECGFSPVVCGNQGCGQTISKRDRTYHESELCQFRKLKYHNCEEISTKLDNLDTKMKDMKTNTAHTDAKIMNMNISAKIVNLPKSVEARFEAVKSSSSLNEMRDGFDHLKEAVLEKIESKDRKQEEFTRDVSGAESGERENQHIFVAGGEGGNSVEIFHYRERLWSLLEPKPEYCHETYSFVARGWSLGNMIRLICHPVADPTLNWSDFAAKLSPRINAHCYVVYKDSLFITGGLDQDEGTYSNCIHEVELKPPNTVKLVSKMPKPRAKHSTVLCDDSILIAGGRTICGSDDNLSSVLRYDIKNNECQQLPELPYPVCEMAAVKWGENVVIIGGLDKDDKVLNKVIIYNIKTGNSHMLPPMLHKRCGCAAVVIENTIVVLGGIDEKLDIFKSVEGFSFDRYTWEKLPDMMVPRYLARAVVI